jgi:hypothetical protein
MSNYTLSIASAGEAKFLSAEALAHERAGVALQEFDDSFLAEEP